MPSASAPVKDFRRSATAVIWGCATGMLVICLSLTSQPYQGSHGTIISLAILAGATISTIAMWQSRTEHNPLTSDQMQALHERMTNLEVIASSIAADWQHSGKPDPVAMKLESQRHDDSTKVESE
jgi:hypothetical protein